MGLQLAKSSPINPTRRSSKGGRVRKSFIIQNFTSPGGSRTRGLFRLAFHPLAPSQSRLTTRVVR